MVVGGWNREKQTFSREALQANAGLLVLGVAGMLFPAIFHFTYRMHDIDIVEHEHAVSIGTSIILLVVYGLGLLFTLKTHAHIFSRGPAVSPEDPIGFSGVHERWSVKKSVIMLLLASAGIAIVAELLLAPPPPSPSGWGGTAFSWASSCWRSSATPPSIPPPCCWRGAMTWTRR